MGSRSLGFLVGYVAVTGCALALGCGASTAGGSTASTPAPAAASAATASAGPSEAEKEFAPGGVNPFKGAKLYLNPDYTKEVEAAAAAASPADAALMRKVSTYPTAIWLDSIAAAQKVSYYLDDAKKQETPGGPPVLTVFVVYDMVNRDCAAKSSAGELTLENGGEARYKKEFIDKIAAQFAAHPTGRIVAIIEPDSLPNLATNLDKPKCKESEKVYRSATAYAISKLSATPNVSLYLDAAHAGWLGWDGNRARAAQVFKDVLTAAGGLDKIRGFATNVSNYNVLHGDDGKKLEPTNPAPDEMTFVELLAETFHWAELGKKAFIIDTARNGRGHLRTKWGNWCNVKGAGLGERPTVQPTALVDAYFWIKPPGEADGTSDSKSARFDENCKSSDAAANAPEAGKWFGSYFADLVHNATPPL